MFIQTASQTWPSGSARCRLYMKPRSWAGLISAVPPVPAAASTMASTASRLSQEIASITSLDVAGGMGRLVNVRHLSCVISMTEIVSDTTMQDELSSLNCGFRVSPIAPLRVVGALYVEVLRNMPLLTLLVLVVFGLPDIGIRFSLFTSAAICMAVFAGAFVCEAVRGGINTVPVGQAEAARSLGFTFTQSLRYVILPPAFRTMVQPLVNIFIGVVLGSSLASAVGVSELTNRTQVLNLQSAEAVVLFLVSGAIYLAIALLGGAAGGVLERRVAGGR